MPSETVLSSGINIGTLIPILLGLLFLGLAYLLWYVIKLQPTKANN